MVGQESGWAPLEFLCNSSSFAEGLACSFHLSLPCPEPQFPYL